MSTISSATSSNLDLDSKRLQVKHLLDPKDSNTPDGTDVIQGLTKTPKSIPPRYFYDDRGSLFFEQICELPEYYPTRTEAAILEQYAREIANSTGACELVELGSGSSTKTRLLLSAYESLGYPLSYVPIDVSAGILQESAKRLLLDYTSLQVCGLVATYERALEQLAPSTLGKRTIFFLGSTLGNLTQLECDRFFARVKAALAPGDYFLLGIDLQKPINILEPAYNDSQGVTAAFNLNMLQHLNWRFQGNFDLSLFEHRAFYNQSEAQIEMHLVSKRSHSVSLDRLDLTVNFEEGETILTEISRKFDLQQMEKYLQTQGLKPVRIWTDPKQWFGLVLSQMH
ncbi:MAG: L-histidine N(alpha)-methyltransferase [Prochloraceae cyanobacterium]|nr:L-histidine N(alpha)-methyltransferase [Prochloraceae cyanobacterium]